MTVPSTKWSARSGIPYFAPVGPMPGPEGTERARRLRAIEELRGQAYELSGHFEEHSVEEYAKAAELYREVALAYDAHGGRSYEARCARHESDRCLEKMANAQPKEGTGTHE